MSDTAELSGADDKRHVASAPVPDRVGLVWWKILLGLTLASVTCVYMWITRELCFSSWLTARVVKARFVRHLVDPLYFHEWAPFEGTPDELMEARRDKLSSLVKLRGSIHNVNKPEVQDIHLPVRGGEILLRIFLPLSPEGGRAGDEGGMAVAIFLHGGGWVVGGVDLEHDLAQDMAIESGAMVVSVGYRLAPEFNFPVPVKDCMAAVRWVRRNIHLFGGDPGRIALVGESAGGNIVLAAAIYLGKWWWPFGEGSGRKQLCAVVAASPPVSYRHAEVGRGEDDGEWRSYRRYWEGYMLNGPQMKGFWDLYLGHPGNGRHPMASPLRASRSQLRRLPPVQLLRAEHEILWDEVVEFGKKLTEAGVEVEEFQSQRCVHGMFAKPGHACGVLSLQAAARFLKDRCS